jgi:hypothetical protein
MGFTFPTLHVTCDGGTKKKPCGHELTVENPGEMAAYILFQIAKEKGWYLPAGGGAALCPSHILKAEQRHRIKILKEEKQEQAKGAGI